MMSEWELWACAEHVAKRKGDAAETFVCERIDALTRLNDDEGVTTWRAIDNRLAALRHRST